MVTQSSFCMSCVARPSSRREAQWVCGVWVCVLLQVCVRASVPAAGMKPQPWELIHPSARDRGDWDPGTGTGCKSPASGDPHYTYGDIHLHQQTSTLLRQRGMQDEGIELTFSILFKEDISDSNKLIFALKNIFTLF